MKPTLPLRLWIARLLIAVVTVWNLQAAVAFWLKPDAYAPAFALAGEPGAVAVRGTALLFIMWNIPYLVALWHPLVHRLSLWEAQTMQVIGLVGESAIFVMLPAEYAILRASILRYIAFDAVGALLLVVAVILVGVEVHRTRRNRNPGE